MKKILASAGESNALKAIIKDMIVFQALLCYNDTK